jgi:hypothetical protein
VLQSLQVAGALTILGAFVLAQLHVLDVRSRAYLAANLAGAAVLAFLAWHEQQWGFVLLESVWALVSLAGLVGAGSPPTATARR